MGRNGLFFRNGSFGEFLRIRGGTIDGKERSLLSERQFRWISKNAGNCARNVSSFETVMIGNRGTGIRDFFLTIACISLLVSVILHLPYQLRTAFLQ
ncbi:unnamed protein product [Rhizophagus irregularis]|nr:unnamed protein product [Rhizophagus irregularis]